MTDEQKARETMDYLMRECRPHLKALHQIFDGHAEITMLATVKGMPGAFILSAASRQIPPEELIKAIQETAEGEAGQPMMSFERMKLHGQDEN